MLINCRMWTTLPQTHTPLKVSLSCTFLKTMKLWSRWSLRADVQQWDTYPEPTELRLIGWLTGSTSIQRSKSTMSTLETNLQTCWPYAHLLATNGTIFSNCSILWPSLSFLASIQAIKVTTLLPCRSGKCKKKNSEDEENLNAWLQNRGLREICSLWLPTGLHQCRGQPGESESKLSNFGFIKHGETLCCGLEHDHRVKFSSAARRFRQEQRHRETSCRTGRASHQPKFVHHNRTISQRDVAYMEKVLDNVRQMFCCPKGDDMDQVDTNMALWWIFMTACMKAAVHLGKHYAETLRAVRNTDFSDAEACPRETVWNTRSENGWKVFWYTNMLLHCWQWNWTSFRNRCCALAAILQNTHIKKKSSRTELGGLLVQLRIVSWTVLMEGQLCSSGRFP